jgi:hypothetical protein
MAPDGPSSDLVNRGRVAAVEGPAEERDDRLTAAVTGKDGASNETARPPIEVARRLAFLLTVAGKPRTWSRRLRDPARLHQGRHRRNRYGFVRGRLLMSPPLELLHSAAVGGEL